jgi:phage terminase large subunit
MKKPTTALRKISSMRKRIWCIQGGQGAGKTYSVLILILNTALKNSNKEIYIASAELSKMRTTVIKDFVKIIQSFGVWDQVNFTGRDHGTPLCRFNNGSFVQFLGLDKEDIGKGLRSDIMYINEANKTNFETYRELTSRAKRVILDYNPNEEFWAHQEVIPDRECEYLCLTFLDNEFLSDEERNNILLNKQKAFINPNLNPYDFAENVKSNYWRNKWRIYGLGITGVVDNRVFENWNEITFDKFKEIKGVEVIGVDWGTVDPWGIVHGKYLDGCLYLHELNYASENEIAQRLSEQDRSQIGSDEVSNEVGLVKLVIDRLKINKSIPMICDTNRPLKIASLSRAGYKSMPAPSKMILDGISILQDLKIYFTSESKNLKFEYENYKRETDRYGVVLEKPEDKNNHLIDPTRYIALYLKIRGFIKTI